MLHRLATLALLLPSVWAQSECDQGGESGSCPSGTVCNIEGCCPEDAPVFCETKDVPRTAGSCCQGDHPICVAQGCAAPNGHVLPSKTLSVRAHHYPKVNGTMHWGTPAKKAYRYPRDACSAIRDVLPSFCEVASCDWLSPAGTVVSCPDINILDIDTCSATLSFDLCNPSGSSVTFEIVESDLGLDYTKTFQSGETEDFPVPGFSISVPGVASAGVNMVVGLDVSGQSIKVDLGVDVCGSVLGVQVCGASITSALPIELVSASLDLDICGSGPGPGPGPSPGPPTPPSGYECDDGSSCSAANPVCVYQGCAPADAPVLCDTEDAPISSGSCCSGDYPICTAGGCSSLTNSLSGDSVVEGTIEGTIKKFEPRKPPRTPPRTKRMSASPPRPFRDVKSRDTCTGPHESCCEAPGDDPNNCPASARTSDCDAKKSCCCG